MKRNITRLVYFVISLVILFPDYDHAQVQLGLSGGINIPMYKYVGGSMHQSVQVSHQVGSNFDFQFRYRVNPYFSVMYAIDGETVNYKSVVYTTNDMPSGYTIDTCSSRLKFSSFRFFNELKLFDRLGLYIRVGFSIGEMTHLRQDGYYYNVVYSPSNVTGYYYSINMKPAVQYFDIGVISGLGYQFKLSEHLGIDLNAGYKHALNPTTFSTHHDGYLGFSYHDAQFMIAFLYDLGKIAVPE